MSNALTKTLIPTLDITPVRNQVLITHPIEGLKMKGNFHNKEGYIYFRNVGDRILIGGARHLHPEEETELLGHNETNIRYLLSFLSNALGRHFDADHISQKWSGILTGGKRRLPILERSTDKTVIATRLGGMGVAIGIDIGHQAATLITK